MGYFICSTGYYRRDRASGADVEVETPPRSRDGMERLLGLVQGIASRHRGGEAISGRGRREDDHGAPFRTDRESQGLSPVPPRSPRSPANRSSGKPRPASSKRRQTRSSKSPSPSGTTSRPASRPRTRSSASSRTEPSRPVTRWKPGTAGRTRGARSWPEKSTNRAKLSVSFRRG